MRSLIRRGWWARRKNMSVAQDCFKLALSKAPGSIAALEGAGSTCDEKTDAGCDVPYLAQIVALRPEYYEKRMQLVFRAQRGTLQDVGLEKILADDPPPQIQLAIFQQLAFNAQQRGDPAKEIVYRRKWSELARDIFAIYSDKYDRYGIYGNDQPLALRLEQIHEWPEAEQIYRRNLPALAKDDLVQKYLIFEFGLGLARSLRAQGKGVEAAAVSSEWILFANRLTCLLYTSPSPRD